MKTESETAMSSQKLDDLDRRYWLDSEGIDVRMKAFACDRGLLTNAE